MGSLLSCAVVVVAMVPCVLLFAKCEECWTIPMHSNRVAIAGGRWCNRGHSIGCLEPLCWQPYHCPLRSPSPSKVSLGGPPNTMDASQQQVEQRRSQLTGSLGNRQAEQEIGGQGRGRRWEAQLPRLEAKPLPTRLAGRWECAPRGGVRGVPRPATAQLAGSQLAAYRAALRAACALFAGMPAQPTPEVYSATEGEQPAPTP